MCDFRVEFPWTFARFGWGLKIDFADLSLGRAILRLRYGVAKRSCRTWHGLDWVVLRLLSADYLTVPSAGLSACLSAGY